MNTPRVTVITATFNSSRTLACAMGSVLAQEFEDFEHIIVGDACTDDSEAVVRGMNDLRVRWHNLARNSGSQAAPNNAGLEMARGEYIAYLGHDDLWFPWHLSSLVNALEANEADLAHSLCFLIGPEGVRGVHGVPGRGRDYDNYAVAPSSWLHRRGARRWRDPDRIAIAVDNDFFWRVQRDAGRIQSTFTPSLVKLPSVWWTLYSRADFPQTGLLEEMRANPRALERRLLLEAAARHAERTSDFLSAREWLYQGLKPLANAMLRGHPDSRLLGWLFQRYRRLIRHRRGLPDRSR